MHGAPLLQPAVDRADQPEGGQGDADDQRATQTKEKGQGRERHQDDSAGDPGPLAPERGLIRAFRVLVGL